MTKRIEQCPAGRGIWLAGLGSSSGHRHGLGGHHAEVVAQELLSSPQKTEAILLGPELFGVCVAAALLGRRVFRQGAHVARLRHDAHDVEQGAAVDAEGFGHFPRFRPGEHRGVARHEQVDECVLADAVGRIVEVLVVVGSPVAVLANEGLAGRRLVSFATPPGLHLLLGAAAAEV